MLVAHKFIKLKCIYKHTLSGWLKTETKKSERVFSETKTGINVIENKQSRVKPYFHTSSEYKIALSCELWFYLNFLFVFLADKRAQ